MILSFQPVSFAQKDQCMKCHQEIEDNASKLFIKDVHYSVKLSCAGCHGGNSSSEDMEFAMSASEGFIGIPSGNKISEICSGCHSDQDFMRKYNDKIPVDQYKNMKMSVHGKTATNGKERILQCTTCHGFHGIKRVDHPESPAYSVNIPQTCNKCHGNPAYIQSYNPSLAVDQLTKYRTSKHGKLNLKGNNKAADCADCHGSHIILSGTDVRSKVYKLNIPKTCADCHSDPVYMAEFKIPTDQFKKYSESVHGKAVFEKHDKYAPGCNDCHGNHGATPPGIASISNVCGSCHSLNAELFSQSPHKKAFDENNYPECETCHGNHDILIATDALLGVNKGSVCVTCHSTDKYSDGYYAAKEMRSLIDSLVRTDSISRKYVFDAEQKGMEVEDTKFKLREIHQARLESRTVVHSFNMDQFKEVTEKGFAVGNNVKNEAVAAIDEYYFRRYGLAFAVIVISVFMVMIFLYIKRIERTNHKKESLS